MTVEWVVDVRRGDKIAGVEIVGVAYETNKDGKVVQHECDLLTPDGWKFIGSAPYGVFHWQLKDETTAVTGVFKFGVTFKNVPAGKFLDASAVRYRQGAQGRYIDLVKPDRATKDNWALVPVKAD